MEQHYVVMYMIYGAVYMHIGIVSLRQKQDSVSHNLFIKALVFLSAFGILHGLSEWLNVILLSNTYPDLNNELLIAKQLFKACSFVGLALFGIKLLETRRLAHVLKSFFFVAFLLWFAGFVYWFLDPQRTQETFYVIYNTILLRYVLAFFSSLLAALGLYERFKRLKKMSLNDLADQYFHLAVIFMVYAVIEGLIVQEQSFFPANLINRQFFLDIFLYPVQVVKIVLGILINYKLLKIIYTFNWEQKEKLIELNRRQTILEERQRMSFDLHDGVMQSLYGIGLKVQTLKKEMIKQPERKALESIETDIDQALLAARKFITESPLKTIDFTDLKESIDDMVRVIELEHPLRFHIKYTNYPVLVNKLPTEQSTHLYYIIQECLINIIKHAKAQNVYMDVSANKTHINVKITDDGIGIDPHKVRDSAFGIELMKKRSAELRGTLQIKREKKGTSVALSIPWGDENYDKNTLS